MREVVLGEDFCGGVDSWDGTQHADLHRVDVPAGESSFGLVFDDLRIDWDEAVVPTVSGVKRHDAGEGARSVDAQLVEGAQVGLAAGTAGGLRSSNVENKCSHEDSLVSLRVGKKRV